MALRANGGAVVTVGVANSTRQMTICLKFCSARSQIARHLFELQIGRVLHSSVISVNCHIPAVVLITHIT